MIRHCLFSSSVRGSINAVCDFARRGNRLEIALHSTGVQTSLVFNCDSTTVTNCMVRLKLLSRGMLDEDRRDNAKRGLVNDHQPSYSGLALLLAGVLLAAGLCAAAPHDNSVTSIFDSHSTPADSIRHLSFFVLGVTGLIFLVVFSLLTYAIVKFRSRAADTGREPAQVYGSTQIELAWTIIPILIVVVLFLETARVIHAIQDAPKPVEAVEVTAIGHQFWWEFRYPGLGIVTANELHVPVSDPSRPTPTFLRLLSADTDHSFWIPQLAGKTDLIPNRVNETWLDPHETGLFLGQCAQYCGTQHAEDALARVRG